MKSVIACLAFLLIGLQHAALAQRSSIKLTAEIPLQFGLAYEGQLTRHFSVQASTGVLTSPNSDIIISYLKWIGTDDKLVAMVDDAFQLGIVGKLNLNYNFGRNYFGTFVQAIGAQAADVSTALVEDYFNVKLTDYPLLAGKSATSENYLTMRTRLYQAGVLYGHRFPLKNDRLEIDAEVGLSGNIGSVSSIHSQNRDLTELSDRVNASLHEYYKLYAFIPSVGVMLVYKLKKPAAK